MILMHHLRIGRGVFTVWLMEELGLDYELKIYVRDENMRAPAELKEAHPLGKSPVIEDDGMVLAESGAITMYLIEKYDTEGKLAPSRENGAAWAEYLQWLHYSEASAFAPLLMNLILSREPSEAKAVRAFAKGETALHLGYLQDRLKDREFILGDTFSGADIGCGYVANMALRLQLLENYPAVAAYAARMTARPAFQRAFAKSGG